ncbi:MAG: polysaccharide biosynthesis/export family protein [Chitinophagaceae bacterium]
MKLFRAFLLLAFPFYFISCGTQKRIPNYLQQVSDTTRTAAVMYPELRIQKNDMLSIQVYSASTKREISDVAYNLPGGTASTGTESGTSSSGFLVDARGDIYYPMIGKVHAEGLTRQELGETILRKINEKDSVLASPSIIIRFQNLRITVLGEVGRQGVIQIPGERVNILEAIGLAGGVTDFGLKQSVKVIRESDGKREVGIVDLSSSDLFASPYYNLQQNDMVLVDPTIRKAKKVEQEAFFRQAGFVVSIITAMAVVVRLFQ